jgi:hypothetical protein
MKKDTSDKTIDLNDMLDNTEQQTIITESHQLTETITEQPVARDWDAIVAEWFYRLPKGYAEQPYTESELKVLDEVVSEYDTGGFKPVVKTVLKEAKPPKVSDAHQRGHYLISTRIPKESNLEGSIQQQLFKRFDTLSENEKQDFVDNFRTHNVTSFIGGGYKPFEKFFNIIPTGKASAGMGRGEVMCILGIKDSRSGGTSEHDVIVAGAAYEVKQLSDGSLDPADYGKISKYKLTSDLNEFYKQLVIPYNEYDIRSVLLNELTDDKDRPKMENILNIFEEAFPVNSPGGKDIYMGTEITYTIFTKWYEGFKSLSKLLNKKLLDGLPQSRMTIKGNINNTYWIEDKDAVAISKAKPNTKVTITVGEEITDENRYAVVWLQELIQSKFISNPSYFIDQLRKFRDGFFGDEVAGLIYFENDNTTPKLGNVDDFATTHITRGVYRLGLKTKYAKYSHTQVQ